MCGEPTVQTPADKTRDRVLARRLWEVPEDLRRVVFDIPELRATTTQGE